MSALQPGADGDPLPPDEWVSRVCKKHNLTKAGEIHELLFRPSSKDREDSKNRLTVWVRSLTPDEYAYALSFADPASSIIAPLNVDEVRKLRPDPDTSDIPQLEVEWHPLSEDDGEGNKIPDRRPGAAGHAGIHDLVRGSDLQRQSLRVQLAMMAQRNRST
jgi:hypothetical protein